VLLNLPYLYPTVPSFREMGKELVHCPGIPPIRALDMLLTVQDKESDPTKVRVHQFGHIPEAAGVLVNTLEWLEPRALKALADGVAVPDRTIPKVYCIGPMVNDGKEESGERHECLAWLDKQPKQNVVFPQQGRLLQSAAAGDRARVGELRPAVLVSWAVRSPPEEQSQFPEPDLARLLPAGFLERTKGRGLVLKSWVPQAEVVQHEALGAFVTHCGWNSTLEAIMSGLPMICWPLYAEQGLNKVFMVEEMKIGVEMGGYEEFVKAEEVEVEAKVRLVMETEEGKVLRERLVVATEKALEATKEGGSSVVAFEEFMRDMEKRNSSENGDCM
jgi:hypothetical protein